MSDTECVDVDTGECDATVLLVQGFCKACQAYTVLFSIGEPAARYTSDCAKCGQSWEMRHQDLEAYLAYQRGEADAAVQADDKRSNP